MMNKVFEEFKKIPRLSRQIIVTEKIDGTNASICITEDGQFLIGSKTKWITPEDDNHGFAKWCIKHKEELLKLGVGIHHGEWWGNGIQRGYGLKDKRFSLFNRSKWADENVRPKCCDITPVLYEGVFDTTKIDECLGCLKRNGSMAVPGFKHPEGVVIFHVAGNLFFKKTIEHDNEPKSVRKQSDCNKCKYYLPKKRFNNPSSCLHKIIGGILYFNITDCEYYVEGQNEKKDSD